MSEFSGFLWRRFDPCSYAFHLNRMPVKNQAASLKKSPCLEGIPG
jgi:hypothetical protein